MMRLLLWLLAASSVIASQAIMCPPCTDPECDSIKKEGEECGGFCGSKGRCDEGLVCRPLPPSPEIAKSDLAERLHLVGGPPPRSHCVRLGDLPVTGDEQRSLLERSAKQDGPCPGCPQPGDPNSDDVKTAAVEAVALLVARGDFKNQPSPKFDHVVSVTTQVVSGIRYSMVIVVLVGDEPVYYQVDVVSQPWTNPPYHLVDATRVPAPAS